MRKAHGEILVGSGTVLFIVAALFDLALRHVYPWVDLAAEILVAIAVALLVAGWIAARLVRDRAPG